MSTYNICFCQEIRKYRYFWVEKRALSRAMPAGLAASDLDLHGLLMPV